MKKNFKLSHFQIVTFLFLTAYCLPPIASTAQTLSTNFLTRSNVQQFRIGLNNTVHIISPEPISYVDISSPGVDGDIAEKKLCRIKPSRLKEGDQFTVTVVSKSFLSVYEFTCSSNNPEMETVVITINPIEAVPVNQHGYLNETELNRLAITAMSKNRGIYNLQANAYSLRLSVNNIFIVGDYIMLDVGIKNKSNLPLDIDQIRFTIKDEKVLKATVSQDIALEPVYRFYDEEQLQINNSYRNFYFFKKFTFPSDKVLCIEFTEKQISGRKVLLNIDYNQILRASTIE